MWKLKRVFTMKLQKFNTINVIPFIDVLLVLLAIVLLTSTFIAKGDIPVSLAKASSANSTKPNHEITLTIKEDNSMFLNASHISFEGLEVKIKEFDIASLIYIKCDKKAEFESFVKVLDLLKSNQFENISIVTKK